MSEGKICFSACTVQEFIPRMFSPTKWQGTSLHAITKGDTSGRFSASSTDSALYERGAPVSKDECLPDEGREVLGLDIADEHVKGINRWKDKAPSSNGIRLAHAEALCKSRRPRKHNEYTVRASLPASLDKALSAPRLNKLQFRVLCELQQQEALNQRQTAEAAREIQQKDAVIHQKVAEIELMRTEAMLKDRTAKLLFVRGLLNVRGVLEWLEEDNAPMYFLDAKASRSEVWQAIWLARATNKQEQKDKKLHLDITRSISTCQQPCSWQQKPDCA
ncbi:hypothetical protein WJX77_010923 [Trebouxia sp. C0004]